MQDHRRWGANIMTKLLGSNCGAKKATCDSILGFGFSIEVKFGFLNSNKYKKDQIASVTQIKEGKDLDAHQTMTAGAVGGGGIAGGLGYTFGAAMFHKKRNVYEVTFTDGNIIAIEETDPILQKQLEKLVYSSRY